VQSSGAIEFNIQTILKSALTFILVFIGWLNVKPFIKSHLQLPTIQQDFLKFKRNNTVFDSLLHKKEVPIDSEVEGKLISFGADHATTIITFITNPFCGYCVESYNVYKGLLKSHGDSIKLNMLFNISVSDKENKAYQIGVKLIELYHTGKREFALNAIDDWFAKRDVDQWQKHYGITDTDLEKYNSFLQAQKNLCSLNKINYTPAIIINKFLYPIEYKLSDIPILIDQIILAEEEKIDRTIETNP
jgi:protein-disulfide isomerase